ncbi:tripartite tricarboxylate transporter TctB family protein [Azospirillum sp. RWY-5-1]|uniref:Tripartite tricarboxylate transporter TctB family protein n=1 Tax=Azospirillum oleiclasticum TaxID=2735135 RepID=A0ABX2T979_9PROT|nr:tripartite tricarboxylate transporter TctB family protein [Azospirillum oleiclasticum]NYZ13956.1 tripartite tricarboxylate transporter TctB family protein [Azospirillum oleiclasticum]NYZ20879.1 tripartite tricarboxylate transporter TctB family protein [Azospirillum oleiclasticum]
MKVNDVFVGLFFLAVGVFVTAYAWTLEPPRHLAYGPGFVPSLIGIGLMLVGGAIGLIGLRTVHADRLVSWPDWSASPRGPLRFLTVPAAIAAYITLVDGMGFLLTSTIIFVAMLVIAGVRPLRGLAVGLLSSIVLTAVFASVLHVPLPWGPLQSVSGWLIW